MSKIDELFKKKVEGHVMEPRSEAWGKLEATLSKKNNGLIWFRAAAALLLVGLFITSIIWIQRGDKNQLAEHSKKETPSAVRKEIQKNKDVEPTPPLKENKSTNSLEKSSSKKQTLTNKLTPKTTIETESEIPKSEKVEFEKAQIETVASVPIVEKPIVIEYTLETVKYLKKETPVVAETNEKKNNLQKALDFAREAKNSDGALGGLRQAKDDLFALNFKKDKQKTQ